MNKEDWKARYREEAIKWEASEELLRRALSRVALVAEGTSKPLDAALKRLQKHVRARSDQDLEADLREISDLFKSLDQKPRAAAPVPTPAPEAPAPAAGASPSEFCADLLDALELSDERLESLRTFRSRLDKLPPAQCLGRLAQEITGVLAESQSLGGGVREVLLALIDEVAVVQPGTGALKTIRETVQRDPDADWHAALSRIIGEIRSIIQKINSDKEALEALVKEVNSELGDITGVLLREQAGLVSGRRDSEDFHETLAAGVSQIQEHIESESDIDRLKDGVSQSLGGIRTAITEFTESDAQRLAQAEERNAELQARVARMEKESKRLREGLDRKREQLMRDTLTGVRSRLAYDETLAQELSRYRRYQDPFSLAVLDIDHFKRVNDTYGHSAGDKALKLVAKRVEAKLRETDLLFRVGGEEFVLLLPRTGLSAARPLVETVRSAVGEAAFHFEGAPVPITVSAGVTAVREDDTAETIFARADDALYRAKKAGRDQYVALE